MAKKYFWLKLKEGFFDNKVIKKLRKIAGGDTYVIIYLKMQLLSIKNEGKLFFDGVENCFEEELALDIDEDVENVKITLAYLENQNLIESTIEDEFVLPGVLELIGSEGESAERVRRYRENKNKIALQCNNTVTYCNDIVIPCNTEKEIEKEIEKDINKKNNVQSNCEEIVSKAVIEAFFDRIWTLYPNKKGKALISNSQKKNLYNIGFNEISVAIQRYQDELKKDGWRHVQNGSTFFNSGYVDYLDRNYRLGTAKTSKQQHNSNGYGNKNNRFNQFPQRQYTSEDFAEVESKLFNRKI